MMLNTASSRRARIREVAEICVGLIIGRKRSAEAAQNSEANENVVSGCVIEPCAARWRTTPTLNPPPTRKSIPLLGASRIVVASCAVVAALLFGCTQSPTGMTGSGRPKPEEAVQHFNRGVDLERQKNFAGAVAEYTEAIKIHNGYMEAYFNRGIARANLGDHTGSVSDFTEVLKIDTNHTKAYRNRAIQRDMQGDLAGAIADYTEVLKRDASEVDILAQRGLAHLKAGNDIEAQKDFDRTFQLRPELKARLESAIAQVKHGHPQGQKVQNVNPPAP